MNKGKNIQKIIINGIFIFVCILCILPIWAIISISITDEKTLLETGYSLLPEKTSFMAYTYILKAPQMILNAYKVSVIVTVVGTVVGIVLMSMISYALSRADFKYRNKVAFYIYFTMLFNGGLVPFYILCSKYLGLKNTYMAMIFPYLVVPWFVMLLRTFFSQISISIFESAKIDGAREIRIFFQILLPLSKPAIATVGLFLMFQYWNDWWLSLLFIDKSNLVPIQLMLNRIMENIMALTNGLSASFNIDTSNLPNESARMAMCILAVAPILVAFPFFQKYFVKGLTVGAVKG